MRPSQVIVILILAISLLTSLFPGPLVNAQRADISDVEEAIACAQDHLLARQNQDGYWEGDSIFHIAPNSDLMGTTALYVLLLCHVGINNPGKRRAVDYLIASQCPDGGWGTMPGANYLAVLALERAGVSPTSPTLQRAYEYLGQLEQQGQTLDEQLFYVKFHYALAGKYPWQKIDLPLLDDTGHHTAAKKPNVFRMDAALALFILNTLHVEGGPSREQRQFLRRAESLLLQQQLPNGSWFNFSHGTIYPLFALYELGYEKNDEHFVWGLRFLASLQSEDGSIEIFKLPVFDTTVALLALEASGIDRDSHEVQRAVRWLVSSRSSSGGWGWTSESETTADIDDTAFSAAILVNHEPALAEEVISFILCRQNEDGGWGTFGRDLNAQQDVKWIPVDSEISFFGDPSIPDGTGHALLALGRAGYTAEDNEIQRAVDYLQRVQFDNGMWFGWWGGPYIYGTSAVLLGLDAVGADMEAPYVHKAVQWLKDCQNVDGGWGEGAQAIEGPEYAGQGDSTSSQTAWAIQGLLAAHVSPDSEVIQRGVSYLVSHQNKDGSWEPAPTMIATGNFPYSLEGSETSWPLWALSSYRSVIQGSSDVEVSSCRIAGPLVATLIVLSLLGLYVAFRRCRSAKSTSQC